MAKCQAIEPAYFARKLTLLSFFVLLLGLVYAITINNIYFDLPRLILIIGLIGPLILCARGILIGKRYTHQCASLLALFYLILAIDLWVISQSYLAILLSVSILGWFSGCILYVRYDKKSKKNV